MSPLKILISSTRSDLAQYRGAAKALIHDIRAEKSSVLQIEAVCMEDEASTGQTEAAPDVSERWVDECPWMVLIVGFHYGTAWPLGDPLGISTTELEYRRATVQSELSNEKRLFVFMAGEPRTPDFGYRAGPEEHDLLQWAWQTTEQREQLVRFRKTLREKHHAIPFANLQMFRSQLGKTLRIAIDEHLRSSQAQSATKPPSPQPGSALAKLIVAVAPAIRKFTEKVDRIKTYKEVHDCLHDIRQHALRPLREEVVPPWVQNGELSREMERKANGIAVALGASSGKLTILSPPHAQGNDKFHRLVVATVQFLPLWNTESGPELNTLRTRIDDFSGIVERAFRVADEKMMDEARSLRDEFRSVEKDIKTERHEKRLSVEDDARLDTQLADIATLTDAVQRVLALHNKWQRIHDDFQYVESCRGTGIFNAELRKFREDCALDDLVAASDDELTAEPTAAAAANATGPEAAAQRSKPLLDLISRFGLLQSDTSDDAYFKARVSFDNAFYEIDKWTLRVIRNVSLKSRQIQELVDNLARVHFEKRNTNP